jgi:hypothetical protein
MALEVAKLWGFGEGRVVFRVMAWRKSTDGNRTDFPKNTVVCNRKSSEVFLGPTLSRIVEAMHESV